MRRQMSKAVRATPTGPILRVNIPRTRGTGRILAALACATAEMVLLVLPLGFLLAGALFLVGPALRIGTLPPVRLRRPLRLRFLRLLSLWLRRLRLLRLGFLRPVWLSLRRLRLLRLRFLRLLSLWLRRLRLLRLGFLRPVWLSLRRLRLL